MELEHAIDKAVGEVRTDALDISFGEMMSLSENDELVIQPDYQRLFRWSPQQQSRLIESILLGLPIPQVFTIQRDDGVLELIDGLQRISSVMHFVDHRLLRNERIGESLTLEGCEVVDELNGQTFETLPLRLKLFLKRSTVRMVIISRYSAPSLRYEMFKRLNTGGSLLSYQEIRNVTARMIGESGVRFYKFLMDCAASDPFKICIEPISDNEKEQKGDEELVLRFLAAKNALCHFRGSVRDWLDNYMENVIFERLDFDYDREEQQFMEVFGYIAGAMGPDAFVLHREGRPIGALKPAYYEAVATGVQRALNEVTDKPKSDVKRTIIDVVESDEFRDVTGPGANTAPKLRRRIEMVEEGLLNLAAGESA